MICIVLYPPVPTEYDKTRWARAFKKLSQCSTSCSVSCLHPFNSVRQCRRCKTFTMSRLGTWQSFDLHATFFSAARCKGKKHSDFLIFLQTSLTFHELEDNAPDFSGQPCSARSPWCMFRTIHNFDLCFVAREIYSVSVAFWHIPAPLEKKRRFIFSWCAFCVQG